MKKIRHSFFLVINLISSITLSCGSSDSPIPDNKEEDLKPPKEEQPVPTVTGLTEKKRRI